MTDGSIGCMPVEEDVAESRDCCHKQLVDGFHSCCFSVMERAETRLSLFIWLIVR